MRYQKLLTRLVVFLGLCTLTLFPWGLNQAQAQIDEKYEPSSILVTELGETVPPGRLNVRFPPRNPAQVSNEIQQLLQQPPSTLSEANISAQVVPANTPEIQELAKGLENDPLAIYDYVHNHIDYIPSWGLLKNPRETLLAGVGNTFDQAALLSALLDAAGFQTRYVFGDIRIDKSVAINWVGAKDPNVVGNVFASGGIPTTNEGATLRLSHIWVEVCDGGTGVNCNGGTFRPLDPSFKSYNEQAGQNLRPLMNLNLNTFIANAQNGATITADFIQNTNQTNIRNDLTGYATNLVTYLRNTNTFMYPEELIGSREIVPSNTTSFPTNLPYQVVTTSGTNTDIPDNLSYQLNIQLPGINYTTNVDDIAGERITIFYECATSTDCNTLNNGGGIYNFQPADSVNMVPVLRVGGTTEATGTAAALANSFQTINITLTTPAGQAFVTSQALLVGQWYALPLRLQTVSNRALARHIDLFEEAIGQGLSPDDEGVLGQFLYVMGLAYFNEVDLGDRIDTRLANIVHLPHFSIMIASRNFKRFIDINGLGIDPGSHSVDVRVSLDTAISAQNPANSDRERAWSLSAGIRGSATEHAIIEQLNDIPAISTIQILKTAAENGQKIYYLTNSNKNAILPTLGHSASVISAVDAVVVGGNHVIIHENPITVGEWQGSGWIDLDPNSGSAGYLISGGLGSVSTLPPLIMNGGSGTTSDHGATEPQQRKFLGKVKDKLILLVTRIRGIFSRNERPLTIDPIDTSSGAFLYHHQDLAPLGGLGIPLSFDRFYVSSQRNIPGPLGYGWSHTFNSRFYIGSDWQRGLAGRTALESAPALAAAQVGFDLFDTANIPHQRYTIDIVAAQWLMAQITGNGAVIVEPDGNVSPHVRLIDGTYQPPPDGANLASVTITGGVTLDWEDGTTMEFNADGLPTAFEDANNNRMMLNYNGQNQLSQVTDAVGRSLTFSYNAQGRIIQISDPINRTFQYSYDGQGNLQTYTDPRSEVTTYGYDSAHRLTQITDPSSTTFVTNQYDSLGRVITQIDGNSGQTSLSYSGDRTIVTDPMGFQTTYFFDGRNRLTVVEDALGNRTTRSFDAADHVISHANGLSQTTAFAYDSRGHLTMTTDPANNTTTWSYDAAGNPTSYTDQRNKSWQFAYNGQHNLTSMTDPLNGKIQFTYNNLGQLTQIQDAGVTYTYSYDTHGNLTGITNALGQSTSWGYDGAGRPISLTNGVDDTTQFSYDPIDNLTSITDALGNQTSYIYDKNGNLKQFKDANNHTTTYQYDAQFNLTRVTDHDNNQTNYTYDANDGLTSITDAENNQTTYSLDKVGRVITITDPINRKLVFGYDAADRLTSFTRADNSTINYQRDSLGRLTMVDYPTGPDMTYGYDAAGNLSSAAFDGWSATYTYDDVGRLSNIIDNRNVTVSYNYDAAGRRTGLQINRGTTTLHNLAYNYDSAARLSSVIDQTGSPVKTMSFTYDAANRIVKITDPGGAHVDYGYDAASRLQTIGHKNEQGNNIATYVYTYDNEGNITGVTETTPVGSFNTAYTYNSLDLLTMETNPHNTIQYSYDKVGNLTQRIDALQTVNFSYDNANQLLTRGSETFSYDPHGNVITWQNDNGSYTYTYDHENLLTSVTLPEGNDLSYTYDAFGRRISLQGPVDTKGFLHDGLDVLLEGNNDLSQITARYLSGDGLLLGRYTPQLGFITYLGDGLDNVRYLLSGSGKPFDAYRFDAYGRPTEQAGIDTTPFRFSGQHSVYQQENIPGLPVILAGFRYFDPAGGRFITQDPASGDLLRPNSLNSFNYALSNPIRYSDPTGLRPDPRESLDGESIASGDSNRPSLVQRFSQTVPVVNDMQLNRRSPADYAAPHSPVREITPNSDEGIALLAQGSSQTQSGGNSGSTGAQGISRITSGASGGSGGRSSISPVYPSSQPEPQPQFSRWREIWRQYYEMIRYHNISLFDIFSNNVEASALQWQPIADDGASYALTCTTNNHLLAGAFHTGLLRSIDSEHATWNNEYLAAVDEITTLTGDTFYAGTRGGGILKSTDSGDTWTEINNSLTANDVYALVINPTIPTQIFAGTEMGLFVSNDSGASWGRPAGKVPGQVVNELAFINNTLLAVTEFGLYRSTNSGGNWSTPTTDLPPVRINVLPVDTATSAVYAGTALGLYRSTDNGETWSSLGTGLTNIDVHGLAIDPADTTHMVVGTTAGLFVSTDSGNNWAIDTNSGLTDVASQIGAVAFCPDGGDANLYLGTGNGVYALREGGGVFLPIIMRNQ